MNHVYEATVLEIRTHEKYVDHALGGVSADFARENVPAPDSPAGRVQRVIDIYRGVRPLLNVLAKLPILPATWRSGIVLFTGVLDSLAEIDVTAAFKAGRDLEPAA